MKLRCKKGTRHFRFSIFDFRSQSRIANLKSGILCALCLLMCLQSSEAQDITNAASFLKIGAGARAIALGGAFVAVADDASAGYWNPAGLTQLPGPVISLADRAPVMDTNYASMTIASPMGRLGFLGLGAIYYDCGDIAMYDEGSMYTGILTDREAALILSYAYSLNQLSLGANAKYIYQDMADENVSIESDGIGADISVLYRIYESLTVGAVFHSKYEMTSSQSVTQQSGESPLNIRAGAHYKAAMGRDNSLSFMVDLDQTSSCPLKLHVGTELVIYDAFALRAGLDDLYVEARDTNIDYLDLLKGNCKPTFGLGLKWKVGRRAASPGARQGALIFDYALSIEKLALGHVFTLAYQF